MPFAPTAPNFPNNSPWSLQAQERFPVEKDGWSARVESYQRRSERAAATRHEYRCSIKASSAWLRHRQKDRTRCRHRRGYILHRDLI